MRRERSVFFALIGLAFGMVVPRGATGQELRGVVRDSASQLPIPGAVVTLLDSAAAAVARTTTNERGQFRVILLGNTVRRVRVVRLGFRPAGATLPDASDGVIRVDVPMTPVSMSLLPVQVVAGPSCPRRTDRAAALSLLEQARAGLLASVVARADKPARMMRLRATRRMDGYSERVVHQRVRIDSAGTVFGSFSAARNAAEFVRHGFTEDSAGMTVYFGPDAEVLLDDGFSAGYCFHLMKPDRVRVNQVGLGFRPANRRGGRIDVDGALWIDTLTRSLVDIEYGYLGVDPLAEPFHPGGHIWFREMPNGVVVIDRWSIRIVGGQGLSNDPMFSVVRPLSPSGRPMPREQSFYGVEVWGELARATWPDGVTWQGPLGTLHLRAVDGDGKPMPGTVVRLADTDYQATADSNGNIELPDLVPGPYRVSIVDPELATLGLTLPTEVDFVAARRWAILTRLAVPEAQDYVNNRCHGREESEAVRRVAVPDAAWLVGRVVTADGRAVPDARWTLRQRDVLGERRIVRDAEVGSDGVFQYCELHRGANVVIGVRAKGMEATSVSLTLMKQPSTVIVVMRPR